MKRIVLCLFVIVIAVGCRQKEEPKPQYQFPTGAVPGSLRMQDDIRLLNEAVEEDPKNVEAWIKLGNIMMDSSRFQEAIEAYSNALKIDSKNVDVRVDMGTCYKNIGKFDTAVKEYRRALKFNPRHLNAHKNLGVVLAYDLKDNAQAVKEFEKYIELAPNAPDAMQVRNEIEKLKASKQK